MENDKHIVRLPNFDKKNAGFQFIRVEDDGYLWQKSYRTGKIVSAVVKHPVTTERVQIVLLEEELRQMEKNNKINIMKCKDCKHRGLMDEVWVNYEVYDGICTNDNAIAESWCDDNLKQMLIYSYNEGGTFYVGDDFGCVHFAPKVTHDNI